MQQISITQLITILVSVFAIFQILSQLLDFFIQKFFNTVKDKTFKACIFNDAENHVEARKTLEEMHQLLINNSKILSVSDESGLPMAYFPRKYIYEQHDLHNKKLDHQIELQRKLLDKISDITLGQERTANILLQMEKALEGLTKQIEKLS